MFGLFKNPTISIGEAEVAATVLAERIQSMPMNEFVNKADQIVRDALSSVGIYEELKDKEYKEIAQLAVRIKSGDKSKQTVASILKSF